jgi:hypothetical protein
MTDYGRKKGKETNERSFRPWVLASGASVSRACLPRELSRTSEALLTVEVIP